MLYLLFIGIVVGSIQPGSVVNYVGNGFDFCSGTYSLAPVIAFTYDANHTWTTPHSKITFAIPDQMFLHPWEKTFESVTDASFKSYHEFYESFVSGFKFSIGIETGVVGFGFNFDRQTLSIHDMITAGFSEIIHGTHYWSYNIASLYPVEMLDLDPMFELATKKFPQVIRTDADKAFATEFVDTFGQFFVYRSAFGAELDFNVAVTETITKSYSQEWVYEQAGMSFHYYLFNVSAGGFTNRSDIHIDSEFLAESKANTSFYGGDPALADITKLDRWVQSVDQNLFPLNATFVPIWTLVTDSVKRQTMQDFMMDYIRTHNRKSF